MVSSVVSPHGVTPVYQQIAAVLRGRIAQGELPAGSVLSSEKNLATEFGVGRDSVRDALALLRGEGLIETRRGFRSRVRESTERSRVEAPHGAVISARMPTPEERVEFDVFEGVPVLVVDGRPYPADRYEVVST